MTDDSDRIIEVPDGIYDLRDFLDYFRSEDIAQVLRELGESVPRTKKERINTLVGLEKVPYEVFGLFQTPDLHRVCLKLGMDPGGMADMVGSLSGLVSLFPREYWGKTLKDFRMRRPEYRRMIEGAEKQKIYERKKTIYSILGLIAFILILLFWPIRCESKSCTEMYEYLSDEWSDCMERRYEAEHEIRDSRG